MNRKVITPKSLNSFREANRFRFYEPLSKNSKAINSTVYIFTNKILEVFGAKFMHRSQNRLQSFQTMRLDKRYFHV